MLKSFLALRSELASALLKGWLWPSPESAFAAWLHETNGITTDLPDLKLLSLENVNSPRLPQQAAVAGYVVSVGGAVDMAAWAAGLTRILAGDLFPPDRQSVMYRPAEALGLAAGAAALSRDHDAVQRLHRQFARAVSDGNQDVISQAIYRRGISLTGGESGRMNTPRQPQSVQEAAVAMWEEDDDGQLASVVLQQWSEQKAFPDAAMPEVALLHMTLFKATQVLTPWALRERQRLIGDAAATFDLLESIFRRFHVFARQLLKRRRDTVEGEKQSRPTIRMGDEYDVQDASAALLRLHFDDVADEEWTPSYAGNSTRIDFLLRRERVAVEQKMTRPGLTHKKVVEQLTIDIAHYQKHDAARALFCFVYDPDGHCKNPAAVESDLRSDIDFPVRVVICPQGL